MTIEEIKSKIQYGDYNTLAMMLNLQNATTGRARLNRGDVEAKNAMESIIIAREKLIEDFKKKED